MQKQLKVTYHYNSGFSVRVGGTLLVFDYWEGENRRLSDVGRLNQSVLAAYEQVVVFISHAHPDHLDPVVYEWRDARPDIVYVVSSDLPIGKRGRRLSPLDEITLTKDISVKAFDSTDLGVSFLVSAYGMGDLLNVVGRRGAFRHGSRQRQMRLHRTPLAPLQAPTAEHSVPPSMGSLYTMFTDASTAQV